MCLVMKYRGAEPEGVIELATVIVRPDPCLMVESFIFNIVRFFGRNHGHVVKDPLY
jgi:hypothetical protein